MEIRLDGKRYGRDEIVSLSLQEEQGWRLDLYTFLLEWWNEGKTIRQETSGSTGKPKLISLEKEMMRRSAARTCAYFSLSQTSRLGLALSTNYIAGKMMVVRALEVGAELITMEPTSSPHVTLKSDLDFIALVPLQAESLLTDSSAVKITTVLLGGAAISPELRQKIVCQQQISFYLGYGMTESCSHVGLQKIAAVEKGYTALNGVFWQQDERGCLLLEDRVLGLRLQTNDLAEIDGDIFFWQGRADTIINSGGIKFSPEKLEELLAPAIPVPFLITSFFDNRLGNALALVVESPSVCYLSQSKRNQLRDRLLSELKEILPRHALPRRVHYVQELVRTDNGKIERHHNYFAS